MCTARTIERPLLKASADFPVVLVIGARQVGKTALLKHLGGEERAYATLDDPLVLRLARKDPALFMQRFPGPVLIDEIQQAPELLPHIKMAVDENRAPGRFWLTGSQQSFLMRNVSESLAERVGILQLLGLSCMETEGRATEQKPFLPDANALQALASKLDELSLQGLYSRIWRGSFPSLALNPDMDKGLYLDSYVQTYLQRDVRNLAQVDDEMAFLRFLRACAARTAQLCNMAELARDADMPPNTAKKWLSILQAAGIVYMLEPYFTNMTSRTLKTPKLYFIDTGLAAHLTEWSSPETLEAGAMSGAFLKTWVVSEILKSWLHNGLRPPFCYYYDKKRKEIYLLIIQNGTIYPVEIKNTASPDKPRHFSVLEKLNTPIGMGAVICLVKQPLPLTESVWSVPAGIL